MEKTKRIKVFACGKIPSSIVERIAVITNHFEDYVRINNYSSSRYYLNSVLKPLEEKKALVKCIGLYEKHEKSKLEKLGQALEGLDTAIILANLRDENSFKNIEIISKIAREKGVLVIVMALIPYSTDKNEQLKYDTEIQCLASKVDTFIPLLAEKIALDSNIPLVDKDGIDFCESYMEFCLEQLVDFFGEGLVNIKKEDFNEIFKDSGLGFIAIGAGEGKDKLEKALKLGSINNSKVSKSKKLLVGILGNQDMDLTYINNILERIQAISREKCNVVFGAFRYDELKDGLIITIIGIENS
ncbi:hypothetical protein [Clostridium peptidivorans]|uniref:hypothetical protein n=1 Tax=Clostridium peptidivorans TaxID=100174 RepID=UPI000BE2EB8B|nr:hypothetical protein [Clostridium peptidivorans]